MATVSSVRELFTGAPLDSVRWFQFTGGSATFTYGNGCTTMNYPASSTSSTDGDLTTNVTYDFTGSVACLNVLSVPSAATSADAGLRIGIDNSNYVRWVYEGGTLFAQDDVAGVRNNRFSVTYNAVTHAWWRIRESGGITFWETSSDGITWVIQVQENNPIVYTSVFIIIAGTCFQNETNPGTYSWRYFNVPSTRSPGEPTYSGHATVGDGMSRSEVMY